MQQYKQQFIEFALSRNVLKFGLPFYKKERDYA